MTKNILLLFILITLFSSCKDGSENMIHIQNTSNVNIENKVISISWEKIKTKYSWIKEGEFRIVDAENSTEIPYQLESLGTNDVVNLLVQVSLLKHEKLAIGFLNEKPGNFKSKTFGRFVPERLDDFAWENDKIAFRMYGMALELGGIGNAYGIDVWAKRTDELVINKRYKTGKYHEDLGDGLDYYHVGFTLGAGNSAPYMNDSIWYSHNYSRWEILDNGPLRTAFRLEYDEWDVTGTTMTATKTISLDAGSQLNKIDVEYKYKNGPKNIPTAIGIVRRPEGGSHLFDKKNGIMSYWEPQHGDDGTTGVGVIIPTNTEEMKIRNDQFLTIVNVPGNRSFTYYTGAAWDKAGFITNEAQWVDYLRNEQVQISENSLVIEF